MHFSHKNALHELTAFLFVAKGQQKLAKNKTPIMTLMH
jgi:hypothetical protein